MENTRAKSETPKLPETDRELPGTGEALLAMTVDTLNQSSEHDNQCQDSSGDPRCDSLMGRASSASPPQIGIWDTIFAK